MKKFFTIGIIILLLLAEMHVAVATHFCGGELADTRVSITGKTASCGMTHTANSASSESTLSSNCCKDETTVYKVDDNYSASELKIKQLLQNVSLDYYIPAQYTSSSNFALFSTYSNVIPPGDYIDRTLSQADICIFRI